MLARHDGDESRLVLVLVALGDVGRGERLAASLAELDDIVALMQEHIEAGDHVEVAIVDDVTAMENLPAGIPVVLLSDRDGEAATRGVAAATLRADVDPSLIAAAARLAAAGYRITRGVVGGWDRHLDGATSEAISDHDQNGTSLPVYLSPREAEVLALLAEGAPNKVIARRLDISVHTVKFHVAAILVKLGAANRTDAIATAMRQGLVLV